MTILGANKAAAPAQPLTVNQKRGSVALPDVVKDRSTDGPKKGSHDIPAESPKKKQQKRPRT